MSDYVEPRMTDAMRRRAKAFKALFVPFQYQIDSSDSPALAALKQIYNMTAGRTGEHPLLRPINSLAFTIIDGEEPDSMASKLVCCECQQPTTPSRSRPVIQHLDGTIDYVCMKCWRELDYSAFLKTE